MVTNLSVLSEVPSNIKCMFFNGNRFSSILGSNLDVNECQPTDFSWISKTETGEIRKKVKFDLFTYNFFPTLYFDLKLGKPSLFALFYHYFKFQHPSLRSYRDIAFFDHVTSVLTNQEGPLKSPISW